MNSNDMPTEADLKKTIEELHKAHDKCEVSCQTFVDEILKLFSSLCAELIAKYESPS